MNRPQQQTRRRGGSRTARRRGRVTPRKPALRWTQHPSRINKNPVIPASAGTQNQQTPVIPAHAGASADGTSNHKGREEKIPSPARRERVRVRVNGDKGRGNDTVLQRSPPWERVRACPGLEPGVRGIGSKGPGNSIGKHCKT